MGKRRVYLSGRMSGLPEGEWRTRFAKARGWMWCRYQMDCVNPADSIIACHPWLYRLVGYRFTLWYDLRLLKRCTHIYMVGNDWHLSRGARLERMKARKWNIKFLEL